MPLLAISGRSSGVYAAALAALPFLPILLNVSGLKTLFFALILPIMLIVPGVAALVSVYVLNSTTDCYA